MKFKRIVYVFEAFLILTALISCDKMPMNGKLDGMWQVLEIQYQTVNGNYDSIVPIKAKQVYWSFQLKLMCITTQTILNDSLTDETFCRFSHQQNQLNLYNFYIGNYTDDILIDNPNTNILNNTGIQGNRADFEIEELTSTTMSLRSNYARILFRKF